MEGTERPFEVSYGLGGNEGGEGGIYNSSSFFSLFSICGGLWSGPSLAHLTSFMSSEACLSTEVISSSEEALVAAPPRRRGRDRGRSGGDAPLEAQEAHSVGGRLDVAGAQASSPSPKCAAEVALEDGTKRLSIDLVELGPLVEREAARSGSAKMEVKGVVSGWMSRSTSNSIFTNFSAISTFRPPTHVLFLMITVKAIIPTSHAKAKKREAPPWMR
ncbi:hypothetical protein IE53DRAFT_152059 [Violaceomyces palustris]|uniref:Uncharacterized protein n=1 Tax=Violaceomyces palustris TaxID=1673888 RepID=A0ACD0NU18_9BASI|nr:hypothetical protein IE53DRAFT_152059 [Violaceomyces palustris]